MVVLAGCGAGREGGFRLAAAATAGEAALELPGEVRVGELELAEVEVDDERRPAVLMPLGAWRWRGRVPEGGLFSLGAALVPDRPGVGRRPDEGLEVQVDLLRGSEREVLLVGRSDGPGWIDLVADLSRHAGQEITLEVTPRVPADPGGGAGRRLAWSRTFLETVQETVRRTAAPGSADPGAAGSRRDPERPNVLLIVVDTLRADRLMPYGYRRRTSPAIQSLLAERGVVAEHAYSQAPWTVPSAVSYLTGRYPGELLSGPMAGYAIPEGVESLGERMAALGYETGAFYGNFVLRDSNGFGRGFATRYTPPARTESNFLHAETVNRRALSWLASQQHRPFFLYVHYMDPHDPYLSPQLVDGRSPFYPGYDGPLTGLSIHTLYVGRATLQDPQRDLAHLNALYDSEVAWVDQAVGELLGRLDPEVARNTLIVFTADHGEEIYDHGGWKHGQTLYDEMIRVPLIFRWDRRLPAGERLADTVELVDLLPTLAAAAGGEADPAWPGRDLLPALAGEERLPPHPAFAQNLASGPLRAAAVFAGKKLILFNRAEPFAPADEHIAYLWRQDLTRLERQELYDLAADPGEDRSLAAAEPRVAAALAEVIHQRLDRALPGLRVMAGGLAAGQRLSGRIVFQRPPDDWHPYFLAAEDSVGLEGSVLSFEWVGEEGSLAETLAEKGLWVEGEIGAVESLEVRLDGKALEPGRILLGGGTPYRGGEVAPGEMAAESRPRAPAQGPSLRLWTRSRETLPAGGEVDREVERSLRALGYIQ